MYADWLDRWDVAKSGSFPFRRTNSEIKCRRNAISRHNHNSANEITIGKRNSRDYRKIEKKC